MSTRIIVASRLSDGVVVYLNRNDAWTSRIDDARAANDDSEAEALLAAGAQAARDQVIVDPYLIEIAEEDGRQRAARLRERIRALGPTVRPDYSRGTEGLS